MRNDTPLSIDLARVRAEAKRFHEYGYLYWRWVNKARPEDRFPFVKGRVIGFAVDGEDRDCLVIQTTGTDGRFVSRCIVAAHIVAIERRKPDAVTR